VAPWVTKAFDPYSHSKVKQQETNSNFSSVVDPLKQANLYPKTYYPHSHVEHRHHPLSEAVNSSGRQENYVLHLLLVLPRVRHGKSQRQKRGVLFWDFRERFVDEIGLVL
jgi:hypothetical protein